MQDVLHEIVESAQKQGISTSVNKMIANIQCLIKHQLKSHSILYYLNTEQAYYQQ